MIEGSTHWDRVAQEWTVWARTPGHDPFWAYRDEFRRFVPAPGARTLEVGCGEGRISRELTDLGHRVTATDISPRLLAAAERENSAESYHQADAGALPLEAESFELVVLYNMLMDVPDMPGAVAEARRVLTSDGTLLVSLVHPFTDRGYFSADSDAAAFVVPDRAGSYFEPQEFAASHTRDGLTMHYEGRSYPLQDYIHALREAGLVITELREPQPARVSGMEHLEPWRRLPMFLWIKAAADPVRDL